MTIWGPNRPPKPEKKSEPGPKPQAPDRCIKRHHDNFSEFNVQFSKRVFGKSIADLLFIEVFSGTGGLTAAIRHIGLAHSIGVDAHVTKRVKSPVVRLDLTSEHGLALLWRILQQDNVAAVHLGPPCGTSSRARDIRRRFGSDPKPLRSVVHPDGLPWLQGLDPKRVASANTLYDITGQIFGVATMASCAPSRTQLDHTCGVHRIFPAICMADQVLLKYAFTLACFKPNARSAPNCCVTTKHLRFWPLTVMITIINTYHGG